MANKTIISRDEGFLIAGIAIGFLVQVFYDVVRELTGYFFQGIRPEIYWLITQAFLTLLFVLLALVVLRRIPKNNPHLP